MSGDENQQNKSTEPAKTDTKPTLDELQSIVSNLERLDFQPNQLSQIQPSSPLVAIVLKNVMLKLENKRKDDELDKCKKEIDHLKNKIISEGIDSLKSEIQQLKAENDKLKEENSNLLGRISRLEKDKQKLSDRSLIADAINNLYELFILEYKDDSLFKPLVKTKKFGGKVWYEVDVTTFKRLINANDIQISEKKPFLDRLEIFTKYTLNYEKISAIYKRVVPERNEDGQIRPLPNIKASFDEFLNAFNTKIQEMENFSDDAILLYK